MNHSWLIADTFPGRDDSVVEYAVGKRKGELLEWMLKNGFSPNPRLKDTETTPLERAIDGKASDIVNELLLNGADPDLGRPLVGSINLEPEEVAFEHVKLLVEHGCDLNRIYDLYGDVDKGFTALDWANGKPKIAEYIRSQGGLTAEEVRAGKTAAKASSKSGATLQTKGATDDVTPTPASEVIAHFEQTVGPASKKSLIQIVPTGTPIGIHFISPKDNRKHLTLFTNGFSSEPMNVPKDAEDYRYAELFIELPGDWKIKEVKDMRWAWPLYWLRKMAQYPHNADTWLGGPVTLIANDEPPQPLWPNSKFMTLLLFAASSFQRSDGHTVQLYRLIPLYTSEREYELKHGLKRFMQALDKHEVPFIVDVNRKPFA